MNADTIKTEIIAPSLTPEEQLVGFFQASYQPSNWWYFLIGPLMFFGMRVYYVAVTDLGVHFHKLNFWGKPESHDFFSYAEISSMKVGGGFLQAPLHFVFTNDRKLKLSAQLKGAASIPKFDQPTKDFLLSKCS